MSWKYQKWHRIVGKSYGRKGYSAKFRFLNPDAPNYQPEYCSSPLTERQKQILDEVIPLEQVRVNQLTTIIKKCECLGDDEALQQAKYLYELKTKPEETYTPQITYEEAKEILQRLTPWKIDWGDGENGEKNDY